MATCPIVSVADAIAAEIIAAREASTFGIDWDDTEVLWGKRSFELAERESGRLRVDVAPITWTQSLKSRGKHLWRCQLEVGVRKKFRPEDLGQENVIQSAEIVALVNLTSDLLAYFLPVAPDHTGRRLTDVPAAVWREESSGFTRVIVDWESLRELYQFTAHFPLTYDVSQESG